MEFSEKARLDCLNSEHKHKHKDYEFLCSSLKLNDYQFKNIFYDGRRHGHTYMIYMKTVLQAKNSTEPFLVNLNTLNEEEEMKSRVYKSFNFKQFKKFLREEYNYFDITEESNTSMKLTYIHSRFIEEHPDVLI